MTVVFETPGLIDVRAFTIMGAHAKPNSSNPIGYFGTGLKYAIAVLVRLGAEPTIWIGEDRFHFSKLDSEFRGTELQTIRMRTLKKGWVRNKLHELPFTTQYGKNWGAWQAFRELESNTRDEGGMTYHADEAPSLVEGVKGKTKIVIENDEFYEAWEKRDEIFLPGASREAAGILEAFPAEGSLHLYYRGMRAYDLGKESIFTYNLIAKQELTEDRTLKYEFYAKRAVAEWVVKQASADQVEAILKADKDAWEFGLEFPSHIPPSDAFKEVMINRRRADHGSQFDRLTAPRPVITGSISRNAHTYFAPVAREIRKAVSKPVYEAPWRLTDAHPRPWRLEGLEVQDSQGNPVFSAPEGYYDGWERTAEAIIKRVNLGMG